MKVPHCLSVPASESQLATALVISVTMMGLMLAALLWQAQVIANQADVIHWLWMSAGK